MPQTVENPSETLSAQAFSLRRRCPSAHTGADVVCSSMLRFIEYFRRIGNIFTPLCGYTTSVTNRFRSADLCQLLLQEKPFLPQTSILTNKGGNSPPFPNKEEILWHRTN